MITKLVVARKMFHELRGVLSVADIALFLLGLFFYFFY